MRVSNELNYFCSNRVQLEQQFDRIEIISELWRSPEVSAAIAKMEPAELRDDLRQEVFLVLCEMPESKLQGLHERGELRWFLTRVMLNMIKSDRSTFYNTHRKFPEQIISGSHTITVCGEIATHKCGLPEIELFKYAKGYRNGYSPRAQQDDNAPSWADRIKDAVGELDWYEAEMLRLYAEMGYNCVPVAKATGIQARSVRYAVSQAREKLKKKLRSDAD